MGWYKEPVLGGVFGKYCDINGVVSKEADGKRTLSTSGRINPQKTS